MEGVKHGFSSDRTVTIDGITYEYVPDSTDPNKGNLTLNGEVVCGKLDDYYRAIERHHPPHSPTVNKEEASEQ